MVRNLLTIVFLSTAFAVSAQHPEFTPTVTPEMTANAAKHTELVARSVSLSPEQKVQVQAVYLQVERQMRSVEHRMEGQPQQDVKADMQGQYAVMDQYVDRELSKVLNADQLTRWHEATK